MHVWERMGLRVPQLWLHQACGTPAGGSNAEALSTWQAGQAVFCTYSSLACPVGDWGTGGLSGALGAGGTKEEMVIVVLVAPQSPVAHTNTEPGQVSGVPPQPQWEEQRGGGGITRGNCKWRGDR